MRYKFLVLERRLDLAPVVPILTLVGYLREMGSPQRETDRDVDVLDETEVREPKKYAVLLHNDDYTTMEFVIEVLEKFFRKNYEQAMQIMLAVHHQGHGVAGIYSFEIAETKVSQVTDHARANGFPLRATLEEQ